MVGPITIKRRCAEKWAPIYLISLQVSSVHISIQVHKISTGSWISISVLLAMMSTNKPPAGTASRIMEASGELINQGNVVMRQVPEK